MKNVITPSLIHLIPNGHQGFTRTHVILFSTLECVPPRVCEPNRFLCL